MGNPTPTANVTVNKGRTKIHNENKIYLREGTEFEIELFNPTQVPVLAKISLNGKELSQGGLVLKPGQRYFLERFLDVAKKFKFETYEVEGSEEVSKAIAKNGLVEVSFYPEKTKRMKPVVISTSPYYLDGVLYTYTNNDYVVGNNSTTFTTNGFVSQSNMSTRGIADVNNFYSRTSSVTLDGMNSTLSTSSLKVDTGNVGSEKVKSLLKETGRIEQGTSSDQSFKEVDMDFEWYTVAKYVYQILPVSQEPVEVTKLGTYCTECGCKAKHTHKFCANCGTKL